MKAKALTVPRIYHPWTKWECFKAGFYDGSPPEGISPEDAQTMYRDFLRDSDVFAAAMLRVICEWPTSCEQFLSNPSMNRIAWLGQSSMCIAHGIPSTFRTGFKLLTPEEQQTANDLAEEFLNMWLEDRCRLSLKSTSI